MNPNQTAAFKILEQAQLALKSGDKNAARQFANQAAQLAPELEEVWLIMGALASPNGSVAYLEKALAINPQSERAKKGLIWARGRVQKEAAAPTLTALPPQAETAQEETHKEDTTEQVIASAVAVTAEAENESTQRSRAAVDEPKTQPRQAIPVPVPLPISQPEAAPVQAAPASKATQSSKTATRSRYSFLLVFLILLLCLIAGWVFWRGSTPASVLLSSGAEHGPAWAAVNLVKGDAVAFSATQAALAAGTASAAGAATAAPGTAGDGQVTSTPDAAVSPASGASETPFPSSTAALPSATIPVATPTSPATAETVFTPTATTQPAFTALPSATSELAVAEPPSPTPLPTDTAAPQSTQYVAPTPQPGVAASGGSGHWIDVDLTHQMVYAYDGNTLVNSFLVSTGTWQHPTVTGQYRVYVKYRYTDMSGPGYYLPNVPYTMYFYQGYALHGTYWHSNFGTPMSHGCVNLSIPDSEWVYNFSSVGTLVNVHY